MLVSPTLDLYSSKDKVGRGLQIDPEEADRLTGRTQMTKRSGLRDFGNPRLGLRGIEIARHLTITRSLGAPI